MTVQSGTEAMWTQVCSFSIPEMVLMVGIVSACYAWFEIKKLVERGVEIYACKACSDGYGVSEKLISLDLDIKVKYVGKMVTEMLKEGWHQLSF